MATWQGRVYVAFVIDVCSRMIVGWRAATTMRTYLVLLALEMAIWHPAGAIDSALRAGRVSMGSV